MRKSFYSPTAIAVTLLLVAGALVTAGERELQQSDTAVAPPAQAGAAEAVEAVTLSTARDLVAAAARAKDPQQAKSFLNQVFALDLPKGAKVLSMAHTMMADLLVDSPEAAAGHRDMAADILLDRREAYGYAPRYVPTTATSRAQVNELATLVRMAQHATPRQAMVWMERALQMDAPANDPQARRLLYTAHITLAESYMNAPTKRAYHLAQAGQYVVNPAERARLEAEVEALGGAPVIAGVPEVAYTPGVADNCFDGTTVPTFTMTGDFYSDTLSITEDGDRDWYTVTLDTGDATVGQTLRIETISDNPGDPTEDDTRLWLYTGCDGDTGEGENLVEFDDDSGEGFMSKIDSQCLPNATYYLKVNGWEEVSTAENITLEIESTSECAIVAPDAFEPDNDRAEAGELDGTQDKSITPGSDEDWNWFDLGEPRLTKISTTGDNVDSALALLYATPNVAAAGLCNSTGDAGIPVGITNVMSNGCNSDADCTDNINPDPLLPDCVPWDMLAFPLVDPDDNPLASTIGGASELTLCLPATLRPSQSESVNDDPADPFHWFVSVASAVPGGECLPTGGVACFDYEMTIEDLGPCTYESSPNGDFASANVYPDGGISGIADHSSFVGEGDKDFYSFDIGFSGGQWRIATSSYDDSVDSFIELWVGPDDAGDFFLVDSADSGGGGALAAIEAVIGPAADAIPNPTDATSYFANVTSARVTPNFPYQLSIDFQFGVVIEDGDFPDCQDPDSGVVGALPTTITAAATGDCDYDGYRFRLEEDTDISLVVADVGGGDGSAIDSTLQVVVCGTEEIVGCDEDTNSSGCASGYCSTLAGCLPGGQDYCVRVRPFSNIEYDYEIAVTSNGSCTPEAPPNLNGDGIGNCRGDGLGRPDFNGGGGGCGTDYTYSECADLGGGGPTFCEDAGAFPECNLPCPDADDECVVNGDACKCEPLLVTMESMDAMQTANGVLVSWTTAREENTVGFIVLREELGSRTKSGLPAISDLIPAMGTQVDGASYSFTDGARLGGGSYNYWIREVDRFGRTEDFGPIQFVPTTTRQARR